MSATKTARPRIASVAVPSRHIRTGWWGDHRVPPWPAACPLCGCHMFPTTPWHHWAGLGIVCRACYEATAPEVET